MTPDLPPDISALAVSAPGLPEDVLGWTPASALRLLSELHATKVAVTDIEVYERLPWSFVPVPDVWQCVLQPGELASSYALRSRMEAEAYVTSMLERDVLLVIDLSAQDETG